MKKAALILAFLTGYIYCTAQNAVPDSLKNFHAYTVNYDELGRKVLLGLLTRTDIENDTSFSWFTKNYNLGKPDAAAVSSFKKHVNDFQVVIFGGTWCEDTQNLLPQFFRLADAAGFSAENISLIGVDHSKKTLDNLEKSFNIVNVPTFIIMKNGKEAGRVVEYGESGEAMKELGKIAAGL